MSRIIASDRVLRDKAFNIVKNPKYYGCQRELVSIIWIYFWEKSLVVIVTRKDKNCC